MENSALSDLDLGSPEHGRSETNEKDKGEMRNPKIDEKWKNR